MSAIVLKVNVARCEAQLINFTAHIYVVNVFRLCVQWATLYNIQACLFQEGVVY